MGRVALILPILMLLVGASMISCVRTGMAQQVVFTAVFLQASANIALGEKLWVKRCQFCHGKAAYPGTAPPLQIWRYKPGFVYDRITNGFRGMPALKREFSEAERKAIVAYVLSRKFSP